MECDLSQCISIKSSGYGRSVALCARSSGQKKKKKKGRGVNISERARWGKRERAVGVYRLFKGNGVSDFVIRLAGISDDYVKIAVGGPGIKG